MPKTSVEPVDAYVGTRVRARRQQLGMSQTALAVGLGVSFQQVQKYEKGANRIGASRLARIAELLQVQVPYFYEGAPGGKGKASQVAQDAALTKFLSRKGQLLVEACNELPAPLLSAVVQFTQDLAKATARQK
jgi:transcriptional regulator with XRE-family HTH domain